MIKQNVYIINYNSLYEILYEIKENLSFNIIKFENEDNFISNCDLNTTNFLIISRSSKKLLISKKVTEFFLFSIPDFPLSLSKLVELINIKLIKLKFDYQSQIKIKGYELDLNSKFFNKNDLSLKLTEKEIEIILYLNHSKTVCDIEDLQKNIWGYTLDVETHTVETHIYRLRKKISNKFDDDNFILSHQNGYFIE